MVNIIRYDFFSDIISKIKEIDIVDDTIKFDDIIVDITETDTNIVGVRGGKKTVFAHKDIQEFYNGYLMNKMTRSEAVNRAAHFFVNKVKQMRENREI